jgi:hypothetical protein
MSVTLIPLCSLYDLPVEDNPAAKHLLAHLCTQQADLFLQSINLSLLAGAVVTQGLGLGHGQAKHGRVRKVAVQHDGGVVGEQVIPREELKRCIG